MPRKRQPPHLKLRRRKDAAETYYIIDGQKRTSTGCSAEDLERAQEALAQYIAGKHDPRGNERHPDQILIADVVNLYATDIAPRHARPHETAARLAIILTRFEPDETLGDLTGKRVRDAVSDMKSTSARRALQDLQAAINYYHQEGLCHAEVRIWKPAPSLSADVWLNRNQVAHLLSTAWRTRERVRGHERLGRYRWRHIAKFILVALYTGSRSSVVCNARLGEPEDGRGWIDLENGIFFRHVGGGRGKKRAPPVRLPARLLGHLRRWHRNGQRYVVEYNGQPVLSVRRAFPALVKAAGLSPAVTPHKLRHTAATWAMQNAADTWAAAGYLGMTKETLESRYGHHHPDHMGQTGDLIASKKTA